MSKLYTVVKGGIELKSVKTMSAAKKLADAQGAEVMYDGTVVYVGAMPKRIVEEDTPTHDEQEPTKPHDEKADVKEEKEDVKEEKEDEKEAKSVYRITTLMNIREKPSFSAPIIGLAQPGKLVIARSIKDDWMDTADGFILFGGGEFAEKIGEQVKP